jgi:hypothetical protein
LYFFIGIPASLPSEFSLTPAGTKTPGHVRIPRYVIIRRGDSRRVKSKAKLSTAAAPDSRVNVGCK